MLFSQLVVVGLSAVRNDFYRAIRLPVVMTSTIIIVFFLALQPIPCLAFNVPSECNFGHIESKPPTTSVHPCSYVGGLFSARRDRQSPSNAAAYFCSRDFHRFGVEQAEALIFAYELLGGPTHIKGYSIYDSCGLMPAINSSDHCVEYQARTLGYPREISECPLVTIVGPFYRGGDDEVINSVVYDSDQLLHLYEALSQTLLGNGVFSLVDEPIDWIPKEEYGSKVRQIVFMQASCDLQARAAVDVLLVASWERVLVVVSSDECGKANKRAFEREIDTRQLEHRLIVEYYVDRSTNALGKRDLSHCRNHFSAWSLSDLWPRCLDEPGSPRAIVVLSSVSFAMDFFDNGYFGFETVDRASFSFLLGDFWGNPARVDDLYDVLMRVTETAKAVIALSTLTNGLDKFQEHMTSIRANSAELLRNSILADYWENFFKCSISGGTCSNTASLPTVNRPILRNYKASLVIDSLYLLTSYIRRSLMSPTLRKFDTRLFFRDDVSISTDVLSWTGNRVRINVVGNGTLAQPTFWSYEILAWTRENGRNYCFPYGVWTFIGDDKNGTGSFQPNKNFCKITHASAVLPAIATPLIVLLLHFVVFTLNLCVFGLASTRECMVLKTTIFFGLLTLASIVVSLLVAVDVFSPSECKTLALDFVVNVLSVLCLAPFFVEALSHLVDGIIKSLQIRLIFVAVLIIFEIVLAGIASFRFFPDDNVDDLDYEQCLNARNQILPIISYWINAGLALACVIIIWVTYGKGYQSPLNNRSIVECGLGTFLAIFYIVAISIVLWVNDCKIQAQWLVVLAAFPGFLTWYIGTFMAWSRHSVSKRSKSLSVEIPGKKCVRDGLAAHLLIF